MISKAGQLIGEGSFGKVYKVYNSRGEVFALKKIQLKAFYNEREQVEKESKLMQECEHRNLVKIYNSQYKEKDQKIEILMQYCEEGELTRWILSQRLTYAERINIFKQITKAFIYLNVKGILHRDLKPQNILIGKNMCVKIADFGCARLLTVDQMSKMDSFSIDKGTPNFVSPQQLMNEEYSAKCDVWAGGCVLYVMTYRKHPFLDRNQRITIECIRSLLLNKSLQLPSDCDPTVARILSLTLVYAEKDRASWRELWLSRFFAPKIQDVSAYVQYLKRVTSIANWISKSFWKERKELKANEFLAHKLTYFLVKFQSSTLVMANSIMHQFPDYRYLFEDHVYATFRKNPTEEAEITRLLTNIQMYLASFKEEFHKTEHRSVMAKDTFRVSPFCDLANAIRTAYKVLLECRTHVKNQTQLRIILSFARLINFEKWYSFEHNPRVEDIIIQPLDNADKIIQEEIVSYQKGDVQ